MSMKKELSKKAKLTQKEIKKTEGRTDEVSKTWPVIVEDYYRKVHEDCKLKEIIKFIWAWVFFTI